MGLYIFISLIVIIINIALSFIIPCFLKNNNEPIVTNIKKIYNQNKQLIITNSIILGLTVYIALNLAPYFDNIFENLTGISLTDTNRSTHNSVNFDEDIRNLLLLNL